MKRYSLAWLKRSFYWKSMKVLEGAIDILLTGHRLAKSVANVPESTGTQATHYLILRHVFSDIYHILKDDTFIDIGCGMGRVLAYLHRRYPNNQLSGIDLNESSVEVARKWASKRDNVRIMSGNALGIDYNSYTVLYLARPFPPAIFHKFIDHLEEHLTHSIQLIYLFDQESGGYLRNRKGWTLLQREVFFKINGFQVASCPQGCSLWEYAPQ